MEKLYFMLIEMIANGDTYYLKNVADDKEFDGCLIDCPYEAKNLSKYVKKYGYDAVEIACKELCLALKEVKDESGSD